MMRLTWARGLPRHLALVLLVTLVGAGAARADRHDKRWVGTWSAAMESPFGPTATFENVTLRQIVHVSIGGNLVRVRLSNAQGTVPLGIGAASIGVRSAGAAVRPRSVHALTFSGAESI